MNITVLYIFLYSKFKIKCTVSIIFETLAMTKNYPGPSQDWNGSDLKSWEFQFTAVVYVYQASDKDQIYVENTTC